MPTATKTKWQPTDAERARYKSLAETCRIGMPEIGRRCNPRVSHTTVADVLKNDRVHFASEETIKQIFKIIEREAQSLGESLNRLMGAH